MTKIFEVVSNLNHDGVFSPAGSFIEGELAQSEDLVADGVLRLVEGAETVEHAAELVAAEKASEVVAEAEVAAEAPQDTWGPAKEPVVAPEPEEAPEAAPAAAPEAPVDQPTGDNL